MKSSRKNVVVALSLISLGAIGAEVLQDLRPSKAQAAFTVSGPVPQPSEGAIWGVDNPNIFAGLAKRVVPSVVSISTVTKVKMTSGGYGSPEDLFRQFFGGALPGMGGRPRAPGQQHFAQPQAMALGSGFVIDPSGIILTNDHVVKDADEIKIQFTEAADEEPTLGKVIGRDPDLDVALIRVKTSRKLIALSLGDSDQLSVGDYVMAAGNPYGQGHSVSHGIVSAKGRTAPGLPIANYLQIDAPINPGNSGGPLVNLRGEVVGINNAIDPRAQGIGFAIPVNFVKKVLPQLEDHGKVSRGYIGAVVGPLTPDVAEKIGAAKDLHAPFVTEVVRGSPADEAGLKPYDAITEVDGTPIHTPSDLVVAVTSAPVGKSIPVKVEREGKHLTLTIHTRAKPGAETVATREARADVNGLSVAPGPGGQGVVVTEVQPESAAESSGLAEGDVILEVDRKPVSDVETFNKSVKDPSRSYLLRVERDGEAGRLYSIVILKPAKAA